MTGSFYKFYIEYNSASVPNGLSNEDQALAILQKAQDLLSRGFVGVGITYSANEEQTNSLERSYSSGQYSGGVRGANQAAVMTSMELALAETRWESLRLKLRIAPITTILTQRDSVHLDVVTRDLARIEEYLKQGWAILGWQNQDTVSDTARPYAIGGGITRLDAVISQQIQNELKRFSVEYPPRD